MEFHRIQDSFRFRHSNEWTKGLLRLLLCFSRLASSSCLSPSECWLCGHSLNDNLHRNHLCKSDHIRYFVCARPTKTSARNCLARVIPSRRFNHRWPKKQHLSKISFSLNKLNSLLKYDLLFTEAATVELLSFRFSTFRSVRFPHCAETRPMFTRHVMFTSSEARWELLQMIRFFKSSTFTSSLQGLKDGKRVAFEQQGPNVSTCVHCVPSISTFCGH